MILRVNHMIGFGARLSREAVLLGFEGSHTNGTDGTSFTFSSKALGAGSHVVVGAGILSHSNDNITGVTVGGSTSTELIYENGEAKARAGLYIIARSGSTADIVVNCSGSGAARCGIGVWSLDNLISASADDTVSNRDEPWSESLDVSRDGAMIAYCLHSGDGGPKTQTWTELAEDFDAAVEGWTQHSGASKAYGVGGTKTVTRTASGGEEYSATVMAAFR